MTGAGEITLWVAVAAIGYAYAGYPLLLFAFTEWLRLLGRGKRLPSVSAEPVPPAIPVAVIVAAHNEETYIGARIENLMAQSYPSGLLRIYVGSDGSTDRTCEIVEKQGSERVTLCAYTARRGKMSVLNDVVARTQESILVFTDANTEFAPDAVERLVARFSDPQVGVVCGELRLVAHVAGRNEDHTYWNFERWLKSREDRIGGLLGANGGIYAMRRELFVPQPANTIVDDFVVSMSVYLQDYRIVYERLALAYEEAAQDLAGEWRRRVRIGVGNFQSLWRLRQLLSPAYGVVAFTFWSHKVMRWFVPHFLLLVFISSLWLWDTVFYRWLFLAQLAGYLMALLAYRAAVRGRLPRLILLPTFVVSLNAALFVGFVKFIFSPQLGTWKRTDR